MIAGAGAARVGLVMPLTGSFMPGARVALFSFLETNPWFDGEVVVLAQEALDLDPLRALWPRIRTGAAGAEFAATLRGATPESLRKGANFQKGEALLLTGFDRLLFIDADMLFRRSVAPALETGGPVAAPPDRAALEGVPRSRADYRIAHAERDGALAHSFCSGFMAVDRAALGPERHGDFLRHMARISRAPLPDGVSDQAIFNLMFRDEVRPLDPSYNYLVRAPGLMPLPIEEARIVHFSAIAKPWDPVGAFAAARAGGATARAYGWWRECWSALNGRRAA